MPSHSAAATGRSWPAGDIHGQDWFPNGSAGAADARARLTFLVTRVAIHAGVGWTRYFHAFNPEPGDALVAGGAVDQYLTAHVAVGYVHPRLTV